MFLLLLFVVHITVALKVRLTTKRLGRQGGLAASVVFKSLNLQDEASLFALPRLLDAKYPFIIGEQFLYREDITREEATLLVGAFFDKPALHPRLFPVKLVIREPALFELLAQRPTSYQPFLRLQASHTPFQWVKMEVLQRRYQVNPAYWESYDKLYLPWDALINSMQVDDFLAMQYNPSTVARLRTIESCLRASILDHYVIRPITTKDNIIRKVHQLCCCSFVRTSERRVWEFYRNICSWISNIFANDKVRLAYWRIKLLLLVFVDLRRIMAVGLSQAYYMLLNFMGSELLGFVSKSHLQHLLEAASQMVSVVKAGLDRELESTLLELHHKFPDRPYYGYNREVALEAWKSRLAASYRPTDDWPRHIRNYDDLVDFFGQFSGPLKHHIFIFETLPRRIRISGRSCGRMKCFLEEAHKLSEEIWKNIDNGTNMRRLSQLSLVEQRAFLRLVVTSIIHKYAAVSDGTLAVINNTLHSRREERLENAEKIIVGSLITQYMIRLPSSDPTVAFVESLDECLNGRCALF